MLLIKRLFSLFLLALIVSPLIVSPAVVHAQIEVDTTSWNDEELYNDDAETAPPYFAVAGGPLGGVFMPNLDAFNKNIAQPFVGKDVNNTVFMIGGQGFISVPWVENLRVGGLGYGGRSEQCCKDTVLASGQLASRTLEYNIGYGGLSIDYVLPLKLGKFWIVPGVVLGLGSVEVYAQQAIQRSQFDIRKDFDNANDNITHNYHSTFFLYMPQLQFEYSPIGFMMARLSVGYQGTAMGKWEVDRGVGLGSTTGLDDVNGNGLVANLGLFFGLFP